MDYPSADAFGLLRRDNGGINLPRGTAAQLAGWAADPLEDDDPVLLDLEDTDGLEIIFEPCDEELGCYVLLVDTGEDDEDEEA